MAGDRSNNDPLPQVGDTVGQDNNAYKILKVLGEGGFGRVYQVVKDNETYALKIEKSAIGQSEDDAFTTEVEVLCLANLANLRHICKLFDRGVIGRNYFYFTMTLLGRDLEGLKSEQKEKKFSLGTSVRVGIQTCEAINELHDMGFISRDLKPSNFAVGLPKTEQQRCVFLIDFGLAKRYIGDDGNHLVPKQIINWVGTMRYASVLAHQMQDVSRKDDLESWFYTLVELTVGTLPWEHVKTHELTYKYKMEFRKDNCVLSLCPPEYTEIMRIIDALNFEQKPPYGRICELLDRVRRRCGTAEDARYDWESEE